MYFFCHTNFGKILDSQWQEVDQGVSTMWVLKVVK